MPASISDEAAERTKHTHQVEDAFARGQAAVGAGDQVEAARWLDRAHRLAPRDATITLFLASATIGDDNARAAALFSEVLASADVRDAWLGLASARFLTRDFDGARAALGEMLSRHAWRPDEAGLADQIAMETGAPGWCGLTGAGSLVVHPVGPGPIVACVDGWLVEAGALPLTWPRARNVIVMSGEGHLIGSPISPRAIGRVEGYVEAWEGGLRGWAWCPGDPDADPCLSIGAGRIRKNIDTSGPAEGVSGLAPLARPRSFAIPRAELPACDVPIQLRGRDGRNLFGRPAMGSRRWELAVISHQGDVEPRRGRGRKAAILITHADGGGVERRVEAAIASHEAQGRRAVVLRPEKSPDGKAGVSVSGGSLPNSWFELPRELPELLGRLAGTKPVEAEFHHFLNHDPSIFQAIRALGVPYDVHTHDYAWFCPRIALVGKGDRYCGEPPPSACEACVAELGSYLHEDISVAALLDRSREILFGARRVVAPSRDAADRMARHFPGLLPIIIPHEDDDGVPEPPPIARVDGMVRVCVAGAIGLHKGFDVLLACAEDARKRGLELTFVVAGTTIDDQRLIDTGRVFVTGPYQPVEAVALIRAQHAALAFLPSIWPETWCLGLTELWRAGLRVAAFDIGAPAERLRQTGRGLLLAPRLSPPAINDTLLNSAR